MSEKNAEDEITDEQLAKEFSEALHGGMPLETLENTGVPVTDASLAKSEALFNELASDPSILALAVEY